MDDNVVAFPEEPQEVVCPTCGGDEWHIWSNATIVCIECGEVCEYAES